MFAEALPLAQPQKAEHGPLAALLNKRPQVRRLEAASRTLTRNRALRTEPSPPRQHGDAAAGVVQRVMVSQAANGAVAAMNTAQLQSHVRNNSSTVVKAVADHPRVNLTVTFDGALPGGG